MTIKTNSDKELVKEIRNKLKENKDKYGKEYCPCSLIHNDDTICMCKEFREQIEGECHCGLYVKVQD